MTQKFCVLAWARTGSNWLCNALNNHPEAVCHAEIFHKQQIYRVNWKRDSAFTLPARLKLRDLAPNRFLDALYAKSRRDRPDAKAIGFKLFPEHNATILERVIVEPEWKLIVLTRRDRLAQYSSFRIAAQTGTWVNLGKGSERPRIEFSEEDFRRYVARTAGAEQDIFDRPAGRDHIHVEYEDIAERAPEIFRHIGIDDSVDIASIARTAKQNSSDVYDRFANPAAARAAVERLTLDAAAA